MQGYIKILGSGRPSSYTLRTTTLIISNEEMIDIIKVVQGLEHSNVLIKGITKTIKN